MKKIVTLLLLCLTLFTLAEIVYAAGEEASSKKKEAKKEYVIDVTVKNIPQNQQTLYIPLDLDTTVFDLDKVSLEGLSAQNILAVAATSKDKVGPGVGLLKLDDLGLPATIGLKVYLKPVSKGKTNVSLGKVAEEPVLPVKGAKIKNDINVSVLSNGEITVTEEIKDGKKRQVLNENKLTLHIQRTVQKTETVFIPIIFDNKVVDLDESFGHSIIGSGISAKTFSSGSLHQGGPGVELVLSDAAEKDFDVELDLVPRKSGKSKISLAFPQEGHTALIKGPVVEITPATISNVTVVQN